MHCRVGVHVFVVEDLVLLRAPDRRSSLLFRFEGFEPLDARRPPAALEAAPSACAGSRLLRASLRAVFLENCRASTSIFVLPSYKEPTVDALAPKTDEGRE